MKRLAAIENLGSMDVLCTDKTGTLTEGVVRVEGAYDWEGRPSAEVLALAIRNAGLQSGLVNPIDEALLRDVPAVADGKLAEIPYDFVRKRLSVVVRCDEGARLLTKGAVEPLVAGLHASAGRQAARRRRRRGHRRAVPRLERARPPRAGRRDPHAAASSRATTRDDECDLTLEGFVVFADPPKATAARALVDLAALGVGVKMITGDHHLVARHVARAVGPGRRDAADRSPARRAPRRSALVRGGAHRDLRRGRSQPEGAHHPGAQEDGARRRASWATASTTRPPCTRPTPASPSRGGRRRARRRRLRAARAGPGRHPPRHRRGRNTFANTLKYIQTTTSANLGNMISMAAASLFLPFLPLLASQILLNNFLSDIPAFGLAGDSVDPELVTRPRRWNVRAAAPVHDQVRPAELGVRLR